MYDEDGSGQLDYVEFVKALNSLDVGLTEAQIFELMRGSSLLVAAAYLATSGNSNGFSSE